MAYLTFDVVEQILLRLDVKDLMRNKSVCKSWQSLISSPSFVKAHLNHTYKNDRDNNEFEHRRIGNGIGIAEYYWLALGRIHVVGSCNGLVCVSSKDAEFVVTNPSTREFRNLPTPPYTRKTGMLRKVICVGFGYDSSADDYKVIAGFRKRFSTFFYALTLKSNSWKVIGEVKYRCDRRVTGVLCGGALYWFMSGDAKKGVIISLDLSTEEFKEIPEPTNGNSKYRLGVLEECLCVYKLSSYWSNKKWVMKNNYWEPRNDPCKGKYDVAHSILVSQKGVYTHDDGVRVRSAGEYMFASLFVKSLVSPYPYVNTSEGRKRKAMGPESEGGFKGHITKRYCQQKEPLVWN